MKYNTGYSFINLKVPQDFRAIYMKRNFPLNHVAIALALVLKKKSREQTHTRAGEPELKSSKKEEIAQHLGEEADAERRRGALS